MSHLSNISREAYPLNSIQTKNNPSCFCMIRKNKEVIKIL